MAERSLTNIPLQEAYSRAKVALEAGTPDRAIAITHHILRYYPQYLDAYRLLGEAYLERGQPDEALRFFTHVLNADPQNVLAYIGKAIIADDRGQVDIAIDAYERAFEMDPSITELRSELLRLYKIRYGSAGATIRTTPSGLAYVHLRAGLRDAAITELGYVAQTRPDRWDIEVALAEALWRNEQLDEAAAVAGDILAGHPTCVKCNWLLGYIHWTGGRTGNGRKYFLDALAHDPTYRIANTIWAATPWPLDRAVTRRQPALVPIWSTAELAGSDLDLSLAYPAITEPAPGPAPAPPPEAPEPDAIAMAATEAGPVEEGLPAPAESAAEDLFDAMPEEEVMLPGPMDLEWFDDWVLDAEMVPPPAPTLAAEPEVVEVPAEPPAPALGDAAQPVMQAMDAAEGAATQDGDGAAPAATDGVAPQDEAAFSLVQELEAVEAAVDGAEREGARAADEQSKLTEAAAEEELATTSEIAELSDLAEAAGQEAPNPGTPAEREEMPAAASAAEAPEPAVVSVETEDSITGVIDAQASDDVVAIAQDEIPGEPALEDSASHEPLPGDVGDAEAAGHELEHRTAAELPIPAGESPPASSRADLAAVAIMAAGELGVIADLDAPATLLPAGEIVTVRGPDTAAREPEQEAAVADPAALPETMDAAPAEMPDGAAAPLETEHGPADIAAASMDVGGADTPTEILPEQWAGDAAMASPTIATELPGADLSEGALAEWFSSTMPLAGLEEPAATPAPTEPGIYPPAPELFSDDEMLDWLASTSPALADGPLDGDRRLELLPSATLPNVDTVAGNPSEPEMLSEDELLDWLTQTSPPVDAGAAEPDPPAVASSADRVADAPAPVEDATVQIGTVHPAESAHNSPGVGYNDLEAREHSSPTPSAGRRRRSSRSTKRT